MSGRGDAIVLVYGSWDDMRVWNALRAHLEPMYRVVTYDRRGHGRNMRASSQGSVHEDADDLAALIEALELTRPHVVANSYGASIVLRLATRDPATFRTISVHEPPALDLVRDDP